MTTGHHNETDENSSLNEFATDWPTAEELTERSNVRWVLLADLLEDREALEIETELANEGAEVSNPHIPATDDVLETLEQWCAEKGLVAAWEVVVGRLEVSDE